MRNLRDFYENELKPLIGGTTPKISWALDRQAARALPTLHRLVEQILQEYQHLKDEQQALDFDDLEGKAAQLLTENENVRARWQRETRAVLVDEFQDTNDRQRQIVYALTGFTPSRIRIRCHPVLIRSPRSVANSSSLVMQSSRFTNSAAPM